MIATATSQAVEFETRRLKLRNLHGDDVEFIRTLGEEPSVRRRTKEMLHVRDVACNFVAWATAFHARSGFGVFRIDTRPGGEPVGICTIARRAELPHPDIGFATFEQHRGLGYAHEAASAVMQYGWERGLTRLLAITEHDNTDSIRLLERLGLQRAGDRHVEGTPVAVFAMNRPPHWG